MMKTTTKPALTVTFQTKLLQIKDWTILRVPEAVSAKLPSRGQIMVTGSCNGIAFTTPLEPDGKWSHWFKMDRALLKTARTAAGKTVNVELTVIKDWPEPAIPTDLKQALAADSAAHALWDKVTPLAHWEWVRWIRSTGSLETRQHRVEVTCSKLRAGTRRPCCWNRNLCTEPSVSKNGVLLVPSTT